MKLVHLSDLHAGKTLGKVSRNEDLSYALEQVLRFCDENSPDLLLIAGDVFDKPNPDNESKELIFDFFLRLRDTKTLAVIISGNHDSYDFMKSIKGLSRLAHVHIYDRPGRDGNVYEWGDLKVACLPYPSERVLTSAGLGSRRNYAELVGKFISAMAQKVKDARHKILLAHIFVAGASYSNTERRATITEHYAVLPSSLSEVFDYVALGHVHRYQRVENAPTCAYYTGTPYQLDFSEAGDRKFFNFVILEDGTPKVEAVELSLKRPLKEFRLSREEAILRLEEIKNTPGLLKLVLKVKDGTGLPRLRDRLVEEVGERLVRIEIEREVKKGDLYPWKCADLSPVELYREYCKTVYGADPPSDVEKKFSQLLAEAGWDV